MKNSFLITEEEKNRILGLHETATKNQYLINEQSSDEDIAGQIYTASFGAGTRNGEFVDAIQKISTLQQLINVDNLLKTTRSKLGLQGQINDEFNPVGFNDSETLNSIQSHLKQLGATMTYDRNRNGSVVINYPQSVSAQSQQEDQLSQNAKKCGWLKSDGTADVDGYKNSNWKCPKSGKVGGIGDGNTGGTKNNVTYTGPSNAQKVQTKLKELDPNTPQTGKMDQATINKVMNILTNGIKPATPTSTTKIEDLQTSVTGNNIK